jgi:RimJ/RimL family protein N-acetyltransferase
MIEGKLVRLRAVEPEDAENAFRWINDREVTHGLMARYPYSLETEREWVKNATKPLDFGNARFAIETKDGQHIGHCGLHGGSAENRRAELGIMIGEKEYWGRGFGTDAMLTLLRFAFEQMNLNKVSLGVFEFNERGLGMYKKCGFVEEGRFREDLFQDGRYWDLVRMSILRREYEAVHGAIGAASVPATA